MEVALAFFKACGAYLQDVNNQGYQRWALPSCCILLSMEESCMLKPPKVYSKSCPSRTNLHILQESPCAVNLFRLLIHEDVVASSCSSQVTGNLLRLARPFGQCGCCID